MLEMVSHMVLHMVLHGHVLHGHSSPFMDIHRHSYSHRNWMELVDELLIIHHKYHQDTQPILHLRMLVIGPAVKPSGSPRFLLVRTSTGECTWKISTSKAEQRHTDTATRSERAALLRGFLRPGGTQSTRQERWIGFCFWFSGFR